MQTIEAIFTGGKFEPVGPVNVAENTRVELIVNEHAEDSLMSINELRDFLAQMEIKYHAGYDSTPVIRAWRYRELIMSYGPTAENS